MRILYPTTSLANDALEIVLKNRGFKSFTRINVYDTKSAVWTTTQKRIANNDVDYVTFGSPSAVQGWVDNAGSKRIPSFVIGQRTMKYAQKLGFTDVIGYDPMCDNTSDNNVLIGWSQFILNYIYKNII